MKTSPFYFRIPPRFFVVTALILGAPWLWSADPVPPVISYQGRISIEGAPFDGNGFFKFALVNASGENIYWNHDNSIINQLRPEPLDENAIELPVRSGTFAVLLGHASIPNMEPIPFSVFQNPDVHLRVWFGQARESFARLEPDQMIASVGYAMMAAVVADHAVGTSQLVDGSVTNEKLAPESVNTEQIAAAAVDGSKIAFGSIRGDHIERGTIGASKLAQAYLTTGGAALDSDYIFRGGGRSVIIENVTDSPFGLTLRSFENRDENYGSIRYDLGLQNLTFRVNNENRYPLTLTGDGRAGIGTRVPSGELHIQRRNLSLGEESMASEHIVVEDTDSRLALFSDEGGSFGSMIGLKELNRASGALTDTWGIVRRTSGSSTGSALEFRYGSSEAYHENPTLMRLGPALEGDGALLVPGGSIGAAEVADEPGVASRTRTAEFVIRGNTIASMTSREIACPADGFIMAIATFSARTSGVHTTADFGLRGPNQVLPSLRSHFFDTDGLTLNIENDTALISLHEVFPAVAGAQRVDLMIQNGAGLAVRGVRLSLVYLPTSYGRVD